MHGKTSIGNNSDLSAHYLAFHYIVSQEHLCQSDYLSNIFSVGIPSLEFAAYKYRAEWLLLQLHRLNTRQKRS